MTRTVVNQASKSSPEPRFVVARVGEELLLPAAQRLVSQNLKDRANAAKRLIASAPQHGIDLSAIWVTLTLSDKPKQPPEVRQACLAVPGSGRTAMIFVSEPMPGGEPGGPESARDERIALLAEVRAFFKNHTRLDVRVLQALPEPSDAWAETALRGAGFRWVGDLEYRRRTITPAEHKAGAREVELPQGVRVVPIGRLPASERDLVLLRVLEDSYLDTKDCPELCGMRLTADILASHYATGVFDPALWFIAYDGDTPAGCLLLSRVADQRALEIVYIGLSKRLRGRGVGVRLMELAISKAADPRIDAITCAVDCRNDPALRLYDRFGFSALGRRRAFVLSVNRDAPAAERA